MKRLFMLIGAVAGIGFAAFATDYEWTGNANDGGLWTTPGNWNQNTGYPQTSSDYARFKKSATVLVDAGAVVDVGLVIVNTGATLVTLNGTEGSVLNPCMSASVNGSSFLVQEGCKLVVNLPVTTAMRIDKWHGGEVEFTADVTSTATQNPLILDNGKITLSGTAAFSAANGNVGIGNYINGDTATLELRDSSSLTAKDITTGISGDTSSAAGHIIQNGDGTKVNVTGGLGLSTAAGPHAKPSVYELNAGTLTVAGTLTIGSKDKAQYVQTGGTSTVAAVTLATGSSASLRGGVMRSTAAPSIGNGCTFELDGGMLAISSGAHKWNGLLANYQISAGSTLGISGAASLSLESECSTYDMGLEISDGATVTVASGARVSAPVGSTAPWKVTINDDSTLKLNEATARLAVPLDLVVNGTGKIQMYSSAGGFGGGYRGAAIAHRLVVDGVEQAKGRYNANDSTFLDAGTAVGTAASIIVPYVWTGAGADDNWNTAANWEGGAVPPSGSPVDISRASTIALNSDVTVSCLVAMPNNLERKTTVTGSGTISIGGDSYVCCLYIPVGCELVLDVDFKRTTNNMMSLTGGGTLTCRKSAPNNQSGGSVYPLLVLDGKMVFDGLKTLYPYTGSAHNFINYNSAHPNTQGEVVIGDGSVISVGRLSEGYPGYLNSIILRQTGGTTTYDNFWMQNLIAQTPPESVAYILEGGEMNAPAGIYLGYTSQVSANSAYPGGSFEMSGGTLRCGAIRGSCNQNYVRLYGGDVYLSGNCSTYRIPDGYVKSRDENAITFYLGGVTFHPVGTYRTFEASSTICLTGKNGDPVFDVTDYNLAIMGGTIEGPGGFVVSGPNGRTFTARGTYTNTGTLRVTGGANMDIQTATLNGPTKIVVEHSSSVVNIYATTGGNPCTVLKDPEVIVLAAASCLSLGGGQALNVKRLVVNGADYAAGTYTFGSGTVTVGAAPASWEVNGVGDLSCEANGTTTTVDAATTLSSLTYDPLTSGETNTLTGAALTFEDGAEIYVEKGATLVINNDVVLGGKVTKTGWGEVVFNGAVSGVATPTASSDETDPRWLTVTEGGATFDGAVQGVRLVTCGAIDANGTPVITLMENCTVSNYGIVLTAWNEANAACCGETHQKGATVDYSTTIFDDLIYNNSNWALTQPRSGGHGRYVLDSGELIGHNNFHLSFVFASGNEYLGSFEFVQNGGTFTEPKNFMFSRVTSGVKFTYTLNGGRFEFGGYLAGFTAPTLNVINLNGGTYVADASDTIKRESFTLNTSGTVTFEVASGKTLTLADDAAGGVSLVKTGAGSLTLNGVFDLDGLDVQSGTVTLTDKLQHVVDGAADLSVARSATLNLDYDGMATFKTLTVGGRECGAGIYSATQGRMSVRPLLGGDGALLILEGTDPGTVIRIR